VDRPPKGLRWEQRGPLTADLRPRIARLYFCFFAAAWNLGLGPLHAIELFASGPVRKPPSLDTIGLVAGGFFLLLALREIALVTHIVFGAGTLVLHAPLAPWVRFEIPFVDISSFAVAPNGDDTYRVVVSTKSGVERKLPLGFETVLLRANWSKKAILAAPVDFASFIATRMSEMLDAARRAGHDGYRL